VAVEDQLRLGGGVGLRPGADAGHDRSPSGPGHAGLSAADDAASARDG
jgi:hypothetical protein